MEVERAPNFRALCSKFELLTNTKRSTVAPTTSETQGKNRKPSRRGSFTFGAKGRESPTSCNDNGTQNIRLVVAREMAARSSTRASRDSGYDSLTLGSSFIKDRHLSVSRPRILRTAGSCSVHPVALLAAASPSPPTSPHVHGMPSPTLSEMQKFTRSMSNLSSSLSHTVSTTSVSSRVEGSQPLFPVPILFVLFVTLPLYLASPSQCYC